MTFAPGQSGNPSGRTKNEKLFRDALNLAVKRTDGEKTKLAQIAEKLVEEAIGGNVQAVIAIADRIDGKPTQELDVHHEGEFTLKSVIVSQLDSFFVEADRPRLEDRSNENVVSN